MNKYLIVGIGGFIGAIARFWLGAYVGDRMGTRFPYGTFLINCTGSFLVGFIITVLAERTHWSPIQMSSATTKPIQFPNEQGLEFTPLSIRQHRIKRWTRTLRTALPFVTIFLHDLKATLFSEPTQIIELQTHALPMVEGRNSAL